MFDARVWSSHLAKRGACVPACARVPPTWREGEPETELGDKLLYAPLSSCQRTRVIILLKSSAQPLSRTSSRSRCSEATHDAECSRKSRLCLFFSPTAATPPHRHPSCLFSLVPFLEVLFPACLCGSLENRTWKPSQALIPGVSVSITA